MAKHLCSGTRLATLSHCCRGTSRHSCRDTGLQHKQIFLHIPANIFHSPNICMATREGLHCKKTSVYRVTVQSRHGNRSRVWRHAPSCSPGPCVGDTLSCYWLCARLWGLFQWIRQGTVARWLPPSLSHDSQTPDTISTSDMTQERGPARPRAKVGMKCGQNGQNNMLGL